MCLCGVRVGGPALLAESRQRPDALLQPGVQLREAEGARLEEAHEELVGFNAVAVDEVSRSGAKMRR